MTVNRPPVIHERCGQLDDPARGMRCPCRNPAHAALIRSEAARRVERARRTALRFSGPQRTERAAKRASLVDPVRRSAPVDPSGKSWGR